MSDLTHLRPHRNARRRPTHGPEAGQGSGEGVEGSRKALRPWFKKKRFAIPLALVAVIGISIAAGGGGDDKKTDKNDNT